MNGTDYQQWLDARNIDIQSLEPDMEQFLRERFEAEQPAATEPVTQVLMVVGDLCQWPTRAIWQQVH